VVTAREGNFGPVDTAGSLLWAANGPGEFNHSRFATSATSGVSNLWPPDAVERAGPGVREFRNETRWEYRDC